MRTLGTLTTPRLCSDSLPSVVKPMEPYEYLSGLKVSAKLVIPRWCWCCSQRGKGTCPHGRRRTERQTEGVCPLSRAVMWQMGNGAAYKHAACKQMLWCVAVWIETALTSPVLFALVSAGRFDILWRMLWTHKTCSALYKPDKNPSKIKAVQSQSICCLQSK